MLDAILAQTRNTALIVGLIAFIGLVLQKKSVTDIISGTAKTIIGFMIFSIGSSAIGTIVGNFTTLFNAGFNIEGVTTQVEIATALALDTYGTEVALVLLVGFVSNLVIAKFTKFKAIFLTGQHFLYFACVIALVLIAHDVPTGVVIVAGGILLGFCGAALPTLCQPFMRKITGSDDLAMGHFNTIGYAFSGMVGKLFAKSKEKSDSSTVELPKFFELFRDFIFSIALFMVVLFYIAVFACMLSGKPENVELVKQISGNDLWFISPLIQGLNFAAAMSVLIYGVRQFIAEITAAFVAISEKYIPNSKPAVDCPAIFPFAPNAVVIGFIGAFLGGLTATALMVAFNSPTVFIPAAGICFFSGGTSGVFGDAYGGWKGALLGSYLVGIALCALPLVLFPAFSQLGISQASFPNIDYNIVGSVLHWILSLVGL
ncbi:PTS beta-glucoside transporter subunit IIBC [Erysipelothrix larvae]|uniref:Ascorbate-specific PTS system EIIC component n=1 Tax=Erysipelothrix larvae TaxID=1514105 RepID=A0A0X8H1I0_9FIRM|nr:PTS ascorbate transporter subunit IIC [Erysipelothrix larvae]AMC94346.1 PTS beta-glucoside transporter subunit IIBC [Erysipelothrix larvae]